MAIQPTCNMCRKELTEFGAILFGPPNDEQEVKKMHLCSSCYEKIIAPFKL